MMEAIARHDTRIKGHRIIPFRQSIRSSTSSISTDETLNDVFSDPAAGNFLKQIVEVAVMDALIKAELANHGVSDDPFDAIYISELKADNIHVHDITKVIRAANIRDLSDSISFDDEWED